MKIPQTTLKQLAELIGAQYVGDPKFPITGFNEIHKKGFQSKPSASGFDWRKPSP